MTTPSPQPDLPDDPHEDLDALLAERARAGDADATERLLQRAADRLFGVCYRMVGNRETAADLTQDALVRIIERLAQYDGRARFSTWTYTIATNICLSHLRSEKFRRTANLDDAMQAPAGRPGAPKSAAKPTGWTPDPKRLDIEPASDWREQRREPDAGSRIESSGRRVLLASALERISEEHRLMLILRDGRGLEYEQIARVLGIAVGTAKSRTFRARQALRSAIEALAPPDTPASPDPATSQTDSQPKPNSKTNTNTNTNPAPPAQ